MLVYIPYLSHAQTQTMKEVEKKGDRTPAKGPRNVLATQPKEKKPRKCLKRNLKE